MFKSFKKFSSKLANNNRGQGMVEYILLIVVVIALVSIFKNKIKSSLDEKMSEVQQNVQNFQGN